MGRHCLGCQERTTNRHQLCEACQERGVRITDDTVEVPLTIRLPEWLKTDDQNTEGWEAR